MMEVPVKQEEGRGVEGWWWWWWWWWY